MYAFSTCLCMACALSEPGGRGLGTLGFSERVAREMVLGRGLFTECRVLHEADNTRSPIGIEPAAEVVAGSKFGYR